MDIGSIADESGNLQDRTPLCNTNHRALYPFATFVYLLRYPLSSGGSADGSEMSELSWFVTESKSTSQKLAEG